MGISFHGATSLRALRPRLRSGAATALMDRYLRLGFYRFLFGIEMDFGDRPPVARLT